MVLGDQTLLAYSSLAVTFSGGVVYVPTYSVIETKSFVGFRGNDFDGAWTMIDHWIQ